MGFHNRFRYRQAHPGPLRRIAIVFPATKLVEDKRLFQFINSWSPVSHTDESLTASFSTEIRIGDSGREISD